MINFNTIADLIALADDTHRSMHEFVLAREMHVTQRSKDELWQNMKEN